jgi:hypothetical protein
MIQVVGVLVTAADREHPRAEHVGKAVDDARRIAPIREHPSEPGCQAEAPIGHRQQHYAAVRCEPSTIKGGSDFLGVNRWKTEWQDRIVGHGGRNQCAGVSQGWHRNQILRRISALHHARQPSTRPLVNKTG